eukprot:SAG31_NODE_774_length_12192_cov_26.736128_5_plen_76_part_00
MSYEHSVSCKYSFMRCSVRYDRLTIKALQPIVKQLNPQELAVVRSYEVKHAGRVTLLKILNRLLLEAEEAAATLS